MLRRLMIACSVVWACLSGLSLQGDSDATPNQRFPHRGRDPNELLASLTAIVSDAARAACVGEYGFGAGATQRLAVSATARGSLQIRREGAADRASSTLEGSSSIPLAPRPCAFVLRPARLRPPSRSKTGRD